MDPSARVITLCVHDWLYAVEVLDEDLQIITMRELERRLLGIVLDVAERMTQGSSAPLISVLGADDRDQWAKVRQSQ